MVWRLLPSHFPQPRGLGLPVWKGSFPRLFPLAFRAQCPTKRQQQRSAAINVVIIKRHHIVKNTKVRDDKIHIKRLYSDT